MAAAEDKVGTKTANRSGKDTNGGRVVADHENIGDGYLDGERTQTDVEKTATERPTAATESAAQNIDKYQGLDAAAMVGIYRTMYISRRVDDKEIQLKGQNKIFFQISGAGHEALLTGAALAMKPAYDWFFPYYRDRALMLGLGMTPLEMLYSAVGAEADPNSHGRQMPSHWGQQRIERPIAVFVYRHPGVAFCRCGGGQFRASLVKELQDKVIGFHGDEVVYMSVGDGTTSEGEWWEALNTAC